MAVTKTSEQRNIFVKNNVFQLSRGVKTFIETSCTDNIHTGEKVFCSCFFWRLVSSFSSEWERVKTFVCITLHVFLKREGQINIAYENKFSSCTILVWCAKVYIYFKKEQLVTFSPIFVVDTEINFRVQFRKAKID